MGQGLVVSASGATASGTPALEPAAPGQKPAAAAPQKPTARDAAPSQAAKVEDAAARTKLTGGGLTLGTGGPMAPGKGAFSGYALIVKNPSDKPMSVNVVSATSGFGSTSSRIGCRSLDFRIGDFFEKVDFERNAKGKAEPAKVTVLDDRFHIEPARDKQGGRCGWELSGTYVELQVSGEGIEQTLGLRIEDSGRGPSGTYHDVECRPTGSRVSTTNKLDVPPGARDLEETVRADGVTEYSYVVAGGLWCSADGGKTLSNGGVAVTAHPGRGAELRLNINLGATYKR